MTGVPALTAPPEVQVGWAITCLRDNRLYGWYEIAGAAGFVNCSRDGRIATRIDGVVVEHSTVEDAALRLAGRENAMSALMQRERERLEIQREARG